MACSSLPSLLEPKAEPLASLSTEAPSCASGAEELGEAEPSTRSSSKVTEAPSCASEDAGECAGESEQSSRSSSKLGMELPALVELLAVSVRGQVIMRCSPAALARADWPPRQALLGSGASAHVWRARDGRGRLVAVKQTSRALAQREREALELVELRPHACILRLLQAVVTPGAETGALILEYCAQGNVESRIAAARGRGGCYVRPQQWERWLASTFLALEHLHHCCRLLHLDVKPGNLFLDEGQCAKLGDFGASHQGLEADGSWVLGVPPGSAGFVAPEIFRQEPFGPSADLYSLGALAWMLLTGKRPPTRMSAVDGRRFHLLCDDHQLLAGEIRACDANSLPAHAVDFMLSLIDCRPMLRLTHRGVREHGIAQPWQLPAVGEDLSSWLEEA